jgi:hypothetical protein
MLDGPEYAQGEVQGSGDVRSVSYGSDKGLFVEFHDEPIYNEYKSLQDGKPHYDMKVMVKIYTPGDKTKVVHRLARLEADMGIPPDPARWPAQWAAYQQGKTAIKDGTPLSEWARLNKQQVQDFNAMHIWTVEQLAEVSDVALDGLGHGGRSLRDAAIAFLEQAKDASFVHKLEEKHASEMAEAMRQIAELRASITGNSPDTNGDEPARRGPGRPRREDA